MIYLGIFVAKIVEIALTTVRIVLINRGEKLLGAVIGFFEVVIWVVVASNVLSTLAEDPFKVVVYCLAFSFGNYLGVIIEDKLAIGTVCTQAMVTADTRDTLSDALRGRGFGVTVIQGQGMNQTVDVLVIYLKRKCVAEANELIRAHCPAALITVSDVRQLRNGFMRK